jgi:hypothetical protein
MLRKLLFCMAVSLALLSKANAISFNIDSKIDATVGLNQPTLDLLKNYPDDIRKQIIDLLTGAKPLIDSSVLLYMNRINQIMDDQLSNIECTTTGVEKIFGSDIIHLITGQPPQPITALRSDYNSVRDGFQYDSKPIDYRTKYADLMYRARQTYCQVENAGEPVRVEVSKMQSDTTERWRAWYRLPEECGNADACLKATISDTNSKIKAAAAVDVQKVDGNKRLSQVAVMKPGAHGFWVKWDPTIYENAFAELFSIQDGMVVAQAVRRATEAANTASKDLAQAVTLVETAKNSLQDANSHINSNPLLSINESNGLFKDRDAIQKDVGDAETQWPPFKDSADAILADYNALSQRRDQTLAAAMHNSGPGVQCMLQATGKKLAGAAKTSFLTLCVRTACESQASDEKLHGAAMTSFVQKCTKDAMTM